METCVGCGSPLAPNWKFCIHCGLAVEAPEIPAAIRPAVVGTPTRPAPVPRPLIILGIGIFLVGIALLVVAFAFFNGAFR
jgi:hypothetical protein